jgi:hypothetical protein
VTTEEGKLRKLTDEEMHRYQGNNVMLAKVCHSHQASFALGEARTAPHVCTNCDIFQRCPCSSKQTSAFYPSPGGPTP